MPQTRLTKTIALLYKMQAADIRQLEAQILEARKAAWANALRAEAAAHGCNRVPNAPRREDLAELRRMSKEDAQSIAATWNKRITAEIERLYDANHRGNRYYYTSNLEKWDAKRREWHEPLVAVTTDAQTAEYARRRFEHQNYGGGLQYIFSGGVAVCKICASLYASGVVSEAFIRRHPLPAHPGCPHQWVVVNRPKRTCGELWLG